MLITLRKKITFLDECSYLKRLNILKSVIYKNSQYFAKFKSTLLIIIHIYSIINYTLFIWYTWDVDGKLL